MRIIAGEFRSRTLRAPDGFTTRPIPDRVKESLFAMLGERCRGAAVVDLFAGSGAIGLEALSRGAASCMFVEQDKGAAEMLTANIEALRCQGRCQVVRGDALGLSIPARCPRPVDLVFMDPPYPLVRQRLGWDRVRQQATALAPLLADTGFIIIRTPWPFGVEDESAVVAAPAPDAAGAAAPRTAPPPGRHRKSRLKPSDRENERPRRTRFIDDDGDEMEELPRSDWDAAPRPGEPADVDDRTEAEIADDAMAAAPAKTLPADLSIAGCKGPETHRYGTTAVHFYMKASAAGGGGGGA